VSRITTFETTTPTATIRTGYNRLWSRLLSVEEVKICLRLILGLLSPSFRLEYLLEVRWSLLCHGKLAKLRINGHGVSLSLPLSLGHLPVR
jgi:hypothetical protein